ncbi:TAP42-like protein [Multifurca ochricompacta]|uniref:TAP42-like protein n=1 Tax=Multifurca ochricompacta TaxID=376703 RepID=A0AAD4M9J1_9AGAM|nr:TAP42-like protein [Multifurca ochricompacta]
MESLPLPLSLSALFRQALLNVSKASNLPTIQDDTQELINVALNDCRNSRARVADLSLFSPNETLDDISTQDLVYLFVPYVLAEIESRARATERDDRLARLREAEQGFSKFLSDIELYEIVSKSEHDLYAKNASAIVDPARRREIKIKQYQAEKEIRSRIERHRVPLPSSDTSPTDFDLIAALLPPDASTSSMTLTDEQDNEDELRTATLLLLRLAYAQAHAQLTSITQEFELLHTAPPQPPETIDPTRSSSETERALWTLDAPRAAAARRGGPLLDSAGKPLQPFTLLPSGASANRANRREQVFQADHRLPTMGIDEYLEIEKQRGNILTGGGAQSAAKPTSSEQLAIDAEQDGTGFGEAKSEEKRRKDEEWASFTDANPRGAGNTMNRG